MAWIRRAGAAVPAVTLDLPALGLALAFGGGLVSFLSPRALPPVPGNATCVAAADLAQTQARPWRALRLALFFVLGFSAVFVAHGAGTILFAGRASARRVAPSRGRQAPRRSGASPPARRSSPAISGGGRRGLFPPRGRRAAERSARRTASRE